MASKSGKSDKELTHGITMDDVSIVEVAHEAYADQGEHKNEQLLVIGAALFQGQVRPNQMINLQNDQKSQMRGCQVQ